MAKARKTVVFTLIKIGRALIFEINGKPVIQFFDPHFIKNEEACLSLGLRPQSEIVVEDVLAGVCDTVDREGALGDRDIIVKLQAEPVRYCSMTRFENYALNTKYPDVAGYILNDVTAIQGKVNLYKRQFEKEKRKSSKLESRLGEHEQEEGHFVGTSPVITRIKEKARVIAATPATVLIQGPTGSGKEVLAHYIHDKSKRNQQSFVKVDCSTLPDTLIESELFGHEKGAFTGAVERKTGRFEQANKGTLFLDEVGNLNLNIQAKLLSVLQDRVITRIGGDRTIPLDIRIIGATNVGLEDLIEKGRFREDLFYRINTISITMPFLKERLDDIPLLCKGFIDEFNSSLGKSIKGLTAKAFQRLYDYAWPGNIRELKNVINRAFIFCESDRVDEDLLQFGKEDIDKPLGRKKSREHYHLKDIDRKTLLGIVKKHDGIVSAIARELSISRQACYVNLDKFKISVDKFRKD